MASSTTKTALTHLAKAEDLLAAEFESVPREVIHTLLVRELNDYEEAKVRDFVPLLAVKAVRRELRRRGDTIYLPSR